MTWANAVTLATVRKTLAECYPGEAIEIIATFDIAHVGREADHQGVLITHDGLPEIAIVDATGFPLATRARTGWSIISPNTGLRAAVRAET